MSISEELRKKEFVQSAHGLLAYTNWFGSESQKATMIKEWWSSLKGFRNSEISFAFDSARKTHERVNGNFLYREARRCRESTKTVVPKENHLEDKSNAGSRGGPEYSKSIEKINEMLDRAFPKKIV